MTTQPGPALQYVSSSTDDTQQITLIDRDVVTDPRERALCRALLHHALALLDASEPSRRTEVGEARRG